MTCALAVGSFVALSVLVEDGSLRHIDQWAVDHVMPGLVAHGNRTVLRVLLPISSDPSNRRAALRTATDIVTLPGSVLPSLLVMAVCCGFLWRRLAAYRAAVVWATAYLAGNAVELLCKSTLRRPPLYTQTAHGAVHLGNFDSSYPSGHTIRLLIVFAGIGALWPRTRPVLLIWAGSAITLLVLVGYHTPTDIAGGWLAATALFSLAWPGALSAYLRRARPPLRTQEAHNVGKDQRLG